jgi:hypothetical protein
VKAYYRGYQRVGTARAHIIRETEIQHRRNSWRPTPAQQAWCGVGAVPHTNSPIVPINPTQPLPDGVAWCGHCVGRAAEHVGLLTDVVALLVAKAATQ